MLYLCSLGKRLEDEFLMHIKEEIEGREKTKAFIYVLLTNRIGRTWEKKVARLTTATSFNFFPSFSLYSSS